MADSSSSESSVISSTTSSPSAESEPRRSPTPKKLSPVPPPPAQLHSRYVYSGALTPSKRELPSLDEEHLKSRRLDKHQVKATADEQKREPSPARSMPAQPSCKELPAYEAKERSLDYPSARTKSAAQRSPDADPDQQQQDGLGVVGPRRASPETATGKFTWCGSCKASSKSRPASKPRQRTSSTSPLRRLSRSSLQVPDAAEPPAKVALSLAKYSPCASRLAASSKILSSAAGGGGPTRQEEEDEQQQQQPRRPARRARSATASPASEIASPSSEPPSPPLADGAEDRPKANAPASVIELSLERDRRSSSYRCPR